MDLQSLTAKEDIREKKTTTRYFSSRFIELQQSHAHFIKTFDEMMDI